MAEKKVMAKVEGKELTEAEVKEFIRLMGPQGMQLNNEEGIKRVADELINQELMYLEAKENNLDEDPEYLREVERIKEQQLKQYAINKVLRTVSVTEDEVKKYYDENKERFKQKPTFEAAHILVEDEDNANKILEEVKGGKDFAEAAKEYSTCPSKENGGELGRFQQGQMVPEFEKAIIEGEVGDITGPVKTQFGYHIIRIDDKTDAEIMDYDQVKTQIMQQLTLQKQQEVYMKKVSELEGKYEVEKFFE